jgi:hypothetical protein
VENFIILLAIFIGFELFESNWQKSDTFYGMLKNNYLVYEKNIILYLCMHPSFFFTLYLSVVHNLFDIWIVSIVCMKFFEIVFKLNLMEKIKKDEPITEIIPNDIQVNFLLRYTNVLLYPLAFYFSVMR